MMYCKQQYLIVLMDFPLTTHTLLLLIGANNEMILIYLMYPILLIRSFCFPFQVTADGSINCANQPDEQESLVGQLIFCEAVAALNLLCQGGNFVFKMFTAFEHLMISLLYLLACLFQEVLVIKPGRYHKDPDTGSSDRQAISEYFVNYFLVLSFLLDK